MDNYRVALAVGLSLLVLLAWNYIVVPIGPQQPTQTQAPVQAPAPAPQPAPQAAPLVQAPATDFVPNAGRQVNVTTPLYRAQFNSQGGVLEHFILTRYRSTIAQDSPLVDLVTPQALAKAPMGLIVAGQPSWATGSWSFEGSDLNLADGQTGALTFTGEAAGLRLVRELRFRADTYLVEETLKVRPISGPATQVRLAFTMATQSLSPEGDSYNPTRVGWYAADKLEEEGSRETLAKGVQVGGSVSWGSLESNYFILALAPLSEGYTFKAKYEDAIFRLAMEEDSVDLDPASERSLSMAYYLGPKLDTYLTAAPANLDKAINLGFFGFIAKPLITALNFFYTYVGNYGVAIILLTMAIKILFWPLSHKSYKSMEQMKRLQPMMAKIREKYADDRQKMNEEIMGLYRTYKVNPAGGCLPMLLQIPVFFGLYQALLSAVELRHAPFIPTLPFTDMVWLADLSAKDPYYITPLIMGASMFIQQKMTPAPGDPTQAKVMLFMPVVFTFMFLNFPSGLVVYWLVNNILSIFQQWWLTRKA